MSQKQPTPKENNEELVQVEILISWALRLGVITCAVIASIGLLSRLIGWGESDTHNSEKLIDQLLSGKPLMDFRPLSSPRQLIEGVWHWQPDVIMTGGLLLLIALPIFRVAMTAVLFIYERDWWFVAITSIVLCVLLSGIFLGTAL